jgi:hypothetical protein
MRINPARKYKRQLANLGVLKGLSFKVDTPADARAHLGTLTALEKELRSIKLDVLNDIRAIRSTYQAKIRAQAPSVGVGILAGRGFARRLTAATKNDLAAERERKIAPYNAIVRAIDKGLLRIQSVKASMRIETKTITTQSRAPTTRRRPIPDEVKIFVWQRDGGRCVRCGSRENLEFDHVIPLSAGGSNTARNIQLLCESCNRGKGANLAWRPHQVPRTPRHFPPPNTSLERTPRSGPKGRKTCYSVR